jgi:hypothetical protein
MKKTVLIIMIVFIATNIIGQGKNYKDVPQKIITAFETKYPSAMIRSWKINPDGYAAEFMIDKKKYTAHYSPDADWTKTETKVRWTWKLPPAVKNALYHCEYASWYVNEIKAVNTPGEQFYEIHVNDGNKLDADHHDAFTEDFLLRFSVTGELIKKEKLP